MGEWKGPPPKTGAEKAIVRAWEYWAYVVEAAKKAEAESERAQIEAADWWKRELAASDAYDRAVARARVPGRDPISRPPR